MRSHIVAPKGYRLRLYFVEPDQVAAGDRVFDVRVNGDLAIESLDICAASGGTMCEIIREVPRVDVEGELRLTFESDSQRYLPVISGIELIAN